MTKHKKLQKFINRLNKVKQTGPNQYQACCPAHNDEVASLSVSKGNNKINFHCHAGCKGEEILQAMGLTWKDIYFDNNGNSNKRKIVATYDYTDDNGNLLYQVVRFKPKTFRQRRPDGNEDWKWGLGNTRKVLYRLKQVIQAVNAGKVIYIVEGEKDADNLCKIGLTATTPPMGAGKWSNNYTKTLTGANVIIIPDNDQPGKEHANRVAQELYGKAKNIKILELPGLKKKQDVSDWLNDGGTKIKLLQLAKKIPLYKPKTNTLAGKHFDEFLPSPIARSIINYQKKMGNLWKYVAEKGLFYYYDDMGYWRSIDMEYLKKVIREGLSKYNQKWDKVHYVKEVISAMKSLLLDPENRRLFNAGYNPDTRYINVINGMLNWKTGKLKPHNPEYYSQFQLPVKYDPKANCPKWKQALKEWVPEKEARMFLQEFVGYCLIPDTSMHKAVILHGSGSNGKSTFLNVLVALFGKNNISNIPLHRLSDRFETANIQDKLVNICPDIDPTYLKETGIIKTMIAGENLRGEYKYGRSFDFRPVVRLIFSANEIPKSRDKTVAWYRRFEIVKFPNEFRKKDPEFNPHLEDELKKELPGILNWSIKGLKRLKEQQNFTQSELIKKAKQEYERENDTVIAFLEDMTEFPEDNYEKGQEVYEEYQRYCKETGLISTSRRTFTKKLKKLGFEVKQKWRNGNNQRCYYGLKLKS